MTGKVKTEYVPAELRSHCFFTDGGFGLFPALKGLIKVRVIFLSDSESHWTHNAVKQAKTEIADSLERLSRDAARYGSSLSFTYTYEKASCDDTVAVSTEKKWLEEYFADERSQADDTATVFCLNKKGRSFANNNIGKKRRAAFLIGEFDARHELLHLFNAKDLYMPDEFAAAAKKYFGSSVMGIGENRETDSLTAFMVGWTDTLDANARNFLKDTLGVTRDALSEAFRYSCFTGFATRRFDNGTYTGYLLAGCPHGKGKFVYDDGAVYDGHWQYFYYQGRGKVTYPDGSTYKGRWKNNRYSGFGKSRDASGGGYTGFWKNGLKCFFGKLRWADGTGYTGFMRKNKTFLFGKTKWTDGKHYTGFLKDEKKHFFGRMRYTEASYTGFWKNGLYSGIGFLKWDSGTRFRGHFSDGQINGSGTMKYKDGTKKTGEWRNSAFLG